MGLCRSERRSRLALLAAAVIYTVSRRAIQFPEMSSATRWKSVKISVSMKSHSGSDNHTATGLLLKLRWSPRTRKNSSCFRNLMCLCAEIRPVQVSLSISGDIFLRWEPHTGTYKSVLFSPVWVWRVCTLTLWGPTFHTWVWRLLFSWLYFLWRTA